MVAVSPAAGHQQRLAGQAVKPYSVAQPSERGRAHCVPVIFGGIGVIARAEHDDGPAIVIEAGERFSLLYATDQGGADQWHAHCVKRQEGKAHEEPPEPGPPAEDRQAKQSQQEKIGRRQQELFQKGG